MSSPGYIQFQTRSNKEDGSEYATYCISKRENGKKYVIQTWLGKTIDKPNGIFYNQKDGFFKFTLEKGRESLEDSITEQYQKVINNTKVVKNIQKEAKETISITFGGIYLYESYFREKGLDNIFRNAFPGDADTLFSLILFRLLYKKSNNYAHNWWNESYAKYLFPNANLESQRISEFLCKLGQESNFQNFIGPYIKFLKNINPKFNVLIDSTGLKNDYNVFITAISNHNGRISNEIRLILVVDKISGYPIYYKFVPGNIVDVNTFVSINNKLKELNININHAVLDAGYYSEENLRELVSYNIPFLIRLIPKRTMYEELVSKHVQNLQKKEYYVKHGNRVLFIKKCKKIS